VIDRAGWMHNVDLVTPDEEGYCNIVGRIKDMVIRRGETRIQGSARCGSALSYPREVEEFLFRHRKV
jgi:acyl-CoA synthetase (AMP-forming)/AMP-acid ligase II